MFLHLNPLEAELNHQKQAIITISRLIFKSILFFILFHRSHQPECKFSVETRVENKVFIKTKRFAIEQ